MAKQNRFRNMYLTTTISVALVLFLVGMECIVILSANQLVRQFKEKITLTVLLKDSVDNDQIARMGDYLEVAPYCHSLCFISRTQALEEHVHALGEDPQKFLGYNPLSDSYEIQLNANYMVQDSILGIEDELMALPYVSSVNYPKEIVSIFDLHVGKISIVLMMVAVVLLLVSIVLIVNTIRLHVYSKRFIINTMRLVGATSWVIRAPFIKRNLRLGLEAGIIALVLVAAVVYLAFDHFGVWLFDLTWQNVLYVAVSVLGIGMMITFIASLVATGRYIKMKIDKMYEI